MIYKHFKGGFYIKLLIALDCNNPSTADVIYLALQSKPPFKVFQPWRRSEDEFNDIHPVAKVKRLRKLTFKESVLFLVGLKRYIK